MRCILWTTAIKDLFDPHSKIGGVSVQMYFWALTFMEKGWSVYTFNQYNKVEILKGINFIPYCSFSFYKYFIYPFYTYKILKKYKPDLIITRAGLDRNLFWISFVARFLHIKHVHFVASDKEFSFTSKSFIQNFNFRMFLGGMRNVRYVVVQNDKQREIVQRKYSNKRILLISNIWRNLDNKKNEPQISDYVLWVANFRQLKRPDRFIELSKHFVDNHFVMIGAPNEPGVYEKYERLASQIPNLYFEGKKDFFTTNMYFSKARIFVCTSDFEGMPNTFLQAWHYNIPVVSTVDPSGIINKYQLGISCSNEIELFQALDCLLSDVEKYNRIKENIKTYFSNNHNAESAYRNLLKLLEYEDTFSNK